MWRDKTMNLILGVLSLNVLGWFKEIIEYMDFKPRKES